MEYPDHNDLEGLDRRLTVLASRASRDAYLRILEELDAGLDITVTMSRASLRARRAEAGHAVE